MGTAIRNRVHVASRIIAQGVVRTAIRSIQAMPFTHARTAELQREYSKLSQTQLVGIIIKLREKLVRRNQLLRNREKSVEGMETGTGGTLE